jgi:hypothetical protein
MSDVRISDLAAAGTLSGAEVLPVDQGGSTVRASVSQVGTFLATLALPLVLGSAAQPGITSVGTLASLSVSGTVTAAAVNATALGGTLTTPAQPNVTSLGVLTSLTVAGGTGTVILGDTFYTLHTTTGVVFLEGNLVVGGMGQFSGFVSLNGGIETPKIVGAPALGVTFRDPSDTTDQIIVSPSGTVEFINTVTLDTDLHVTGIATFTGSVTFNAPTNFNDGFTVFANTVTVDFETDVLISGNLHVVPGAQFDGGITIMNGGLSAAGGIVISTGVSGAGILTFGDAVGQVIPGVTSISFRDTANAHDNLLIADNGNITVRGTLGGVTTLTATTLAGTLSTAAQPNVTSVGTLTGLTVSATGITFTVGTSSLFVLSSTDNEGPVFLRRHSSTGRTEIGFQDETPATLWRLGLTGAGVNNFLLVNQATGKQVITVNAVSSNILVQQSIGVGVVVSTSAALAVGSGSLSTALVGTTQDGILVTFEGNSAGTGDINGMRIRGQTAAAAFTVSTLTGIHVLDTVLGAGSTITQQIGLQVDAQTQGTTSYGVFITQGTIAVGLHVGQTSGTTQVGIRVTGGTQTGSTQTAVLSLAQTWNTTGAPSGLFMGITNTASAAGARLVDLQVGGTSVFSVDVVGRVRTIALTLTPVTAGVAMILTQQASMTVDAIQVASGTLTGAAAPSILNLAQTWNTTGAPKGILLNITNTASAAGARLIDLQIAAASKFAVDVAGTVYVAATQVVSTRKTGWTAWTGTALRTTVATGSATTLQVAEAMKALLDDLIAHGLIGT